MHTVARIDSENFTITTNDRFTGGNRYRVPVEWRPRSFGHHDDHVYAGAREKPQLKPIIDRGLRKGKHSRDMLSLHTDVERDAAYL